MWRRFRTAILFVAAVIVALNIENLAIFIGLDGTLVSLAQFIPIQLQRIWAFITAPTVLVTSIVVLAFAAGTRWDEFFRNQRAKRKVSTETRELLASRCERIAYAMDVNAEFYDSDQGLVDGINWQLQKVQENMKYYLGVYLNFQDKNKTQAAELSIFLKDAAVEIRKENFGELLQLIEGYNAKVSTIKKPLALPSASPPKLSVPPDQPVQ